MNKLLSTHAFSDSAEESWERKDYSIACSLSPALIHELVMTQVDGVQVITTFIVSIENFELIALRIVNFGVME